MSFLSKIFGSKKSSAAPTRPLRLAKQGGREGKLVGEVTHYYSDLGVAIVKFKEDIGVGAALHFVGATTNFTDTVKSMQYDHKPIETAKKGQEVGIKVKDKVREGDQVYLAE